MDNIQFLEDLYTELADIERRQQNLTLPRSEQQELCQAWEEIAKKIDDLESDLYGPPHEDTADWRDDLASDSRAHTPPAPEPVRLAPPPPPPVVRTRSSHGVPPPPSVAGAAWSPPPVEIPRITHLISAAPLPPRACDDRRYSDYDTEEEDYDSDEIEQWNQIVDDREGCENCPGCHYCRDGHGYDGNDEI